MDEIIAVTVATVSFFFPNIVITKLITVFQLITKHPFHNGSTAIYISVLRKQIGDIDDIVFGNVKKCAVGKYPKSEKLGSAGQAACCACAHSRYLTGGSPSGLRV